MTVPSAGPVDLSRSAPPGALKPVYRAVAEATNPRDDVHLSDTPEAELSLGQKLALATMASIAVVSAVALSMPPSLAKAAVAAQHDPILSEHPTLWQEPLRLGATGDRVLKFQEGLSHFQPVEPTGVFDEQTEAAVRAFQKAHGQKDDGVVGERTYGVLWSRLFWEKGIALDQQGPEFFASLPTDLKVVVDVSLQRLFFVDGATGKAVREYPVSTGSEEFPTPLRSYRVSHEHEKPYWNPPPSTWAEGQKRTPPGPTNPLGPMALRLSGSTILIHGVPVSSFGSLGKSGQSHGCIRMFPQHVWEVSQAVKVGTPVRVVATSGL